MFTTSALRFQFSFFYKSEHVVYQKTCFLVHTTVFYNMYNNYSRPKYFLFRFAEPTAIPLTEAPVVFFHHHGSLVWLHNDPNYSVISKLASDNGYSRIFFV